MYTSEPIRHSGVGANPSVYGQTGISSTDGQVGQSPHLSRHITLPLLFANHLIARRLLPAAKLFTSPLITKAFPLVASRGLLLPSWSIAAASRSASSSLPLVSLLYLDSAGRSK
jgi:hypothetical protein